MKLFYLFVMAPLFIAAALLANWQSKAGADKFWKPFDGNFPLSNTGDFSAEG